jgi:hypothetical protein
MPLKEIEISIFTDRSTLNEPGPNLIPKLIDDDPFHINKIVRLIDYVKLRKKVCKLHGGNAVQLSQLVHLNFDSFQMVQMVREYDWLYFYLLKLHDRILTEYFVNNKHKFQNFEQHFAPRILYLSDALNLYRNGLLKQQNGE